MTDEGPHADRLGSTRLLTDVTGTISATYRTDEWGVATAQTGSSTQPFGYTGEPRDATGLTYLRARYYDPSLGRFMSRDTWEGNPTRPEMLNRQAYVANNPCTAADPSGRSPSSKVLNQASENETCEVVAGIAGGAHFVAVGLDVGATAAAIFAMPSVVAEVFLIPGDLGLLYLTYLTDEIGREAATHPCNDIHPKLWPF